MERKKMWLTQNYIFSAEFLTETRGCTVFRRFCWALITAKWGSERARVISAGRIHAYNKTVLNCTKVLHMSYIVKSVFFPPDVYCLFESSIWHPDNWPSLVLTFGWPQLQDLLNVGSPFNRLSWEGPAAGPLVYHTKAFGRRQKK